MEKINTSKKEISNVLGENFQQNSSCSMALFHRGIRNRRTASSVAEFASNLGNPLDGYG